MFSYQFGLVFFFFETFRPCFQIRQFYVQLTISVNTLGTIKRSKMIERNNYKEYSPNIPKIKNDRRG